MPTDTEQCTGMSHASSSAYIKNSVCTVHCQGECPSVCNERCLHLDVKRREMLSALCFALVDIIWTPKIVDIVVDSRAYWSLFNAVAGASWGAPICIYYSANTSTHQSSRSSNPSNPSIYLTWLICFRHTHIAAALQQFS